MKDCSWKAFVRQILIASCKLSNEIKPRCLFKLLNITESGIGRAEAALNAICRRATIRKHARCIVC